LMTEGDPPFHTYLEAMRRRMACMPGWVALCRWLKICRQRFLGTRVVTYQW